MNNKIDVFDEIFLGDADEQREVWMFLEMLLRRGRLDKSIMSAAPTMCERFDYTFFEAQLIVKNWYINRTKEYYEPYEEELKKMIKLPVMHGYIDDDEE